MRRIALLIIWCLAFMANVPAQQSNEQLAAYYYDHGEFEQAAQLYEGLYKQSSNKYYYQRLLVTYMELEQYKEAVRLVERRQKSTPKDLSLYVDEGRIYLHQEQPKKAQKCFDKAIESITNNIQPVPELAQAFISIGRADYAVQAYLTARAKTRNAHLYFNELIGTYQQMGNYEAMTDEYFNLIDHQPGMMNNVQISMQKALAEAPDDRLANGVRRALVSRVQEHPDNRSYLEMMIWFSLQQKDFQFALEQAEAIEARFADIGGEQVMRVANIAQNNDDLDVAEEAYRYLQRKGPDNQYYFDSRVGELNVGFARINSNYSIDSASLNSLIKRYRAAFDELGKNERTVTLMRNYANLVSYHGGNAQDAVSILDDVLELPRLKPQIRDEVKLELGDLLLFAGETWDASLLYMQVEKANKNDVLGAMAKFKNAKLSYYNHDFEWAKSQLDVLRASTSKLVANDAMELSLLISDNMEDDSTYGVLELFADADLLLYRNMLDSAWKGYDAVTMGVLSHPLFDDVLMRKAQIRMKQARYAEADSLLQRLIDFYPEDITADDAIIMQAELNEDKLNNPVKALECYEKILLDYPSSLYVDYARRRYNILKAK